MTIDELKKMDKVVMVLSKRRSNVSAYVNDLEKFIKAIRNKVVEEMQQAIDNLKIDDSELVGELKVSAKAANSALTMVERALDKIEKGE